MHYSSWEEYLKHEKKKRERLDDETAEKSFLLYAKSYELEGHAVLKAVLQDDNGEERVSRLDLNNHIGAEIGGNQNPYLTWGHGFVQKTTIDHTEIHRNREWGPMYCVRFSMWDDFWKCTYSEIHQRFNLGDHVTVKNGELAFTWGLLVGVPRPPIEEPWRFYFKDLKGLELLLSMQDVQRCFLADSQGAQHLQRQALSFKYYYPDLEAGEDLRNGDMTPFLLWLRLEFRAGRLSIRKKIEKNFGPLEDDRLASWLM